MNYSDLKFKLLVGSSTNQLAEVSETVLADSNLKTLIELIKVKTWLSLTERDKTTHLKKRGEHDIATEISVVSNLTNIVLEAQKLYSAELLAGGRKMSFNHYDDYNYDQRLMLFSMNDPVEKSLSNKNHSNWIQPARIERIWLTNFFNSLHDYFNFNDLQKDGHTRVKIKVNVPRINKLLVNSTEFNYGYAGLYLDQSLNYNGQGFDILQQLFLIPPQNFSETIYLIRNFISGMAIMHGIKITQIIFRDVSTERRRGCLFIEYFDHLDGRMHVISIKSHINDPRNEFFREHYWASWAESETADIQGFYKLFQRYDDALFDEYYDPRYAETILEVENYTARPNIINQTDSFGISNTDKLVSLLGLNRHDLLDNYEKVSHNLLKPVHNGGGAAHAIWSIMNVYMRKAAEQDNTILNGKYKAVDFRVFWNNTFDYSENREKQIKESFDVSGPTKRVEAIEVPMFPYSEKDNWDYSEWNASRSVSNLTKTYDNSMYQDRLSITALRALAINKIIIDMLELAEGDISNNWKAVHPGFARAIVTSGPPSIGFKVNIYETVDDIMSRMIYYTKLIKNLTDWKKAVKSIIDSSIEIDILKDKVTPSPLTSIMYLIDKNLDDWMIREDIINDGNLETPIIGNRSLRQVKLTLQKAISDSDKTDIKNILFSLNFKSNNSLQYYIEISALDTPLTLIKI